MYYILISPKPTMKLSGFHLRELFLHNKEKINMKSEQVISKFNYFQDVAVFP